MARSRQHIPLRVFLRDAEVGLLMKNPSGAISFTYNPAWLEKENAVPVSLSLPLRDDAFTGAAVQYVFENLLPDSDSISQGIIMRLQKWQ